MRKYVGGEISSHDAADLLKHSYYKTHTDEGDYLIDPELSNQYAQTYTKDGRAYVVHRGTKGATDWLTNARMLFGDKNDYRFRAGRDIQQKAENKYGSKNITTLGHSLGSQIAKEVGKNSHEIIAYNRPTLPLDIINNDLPSNLHDIRTSFDPVSALRGIEKGNVHTIQSKSWNPFYEHRTDRIKDEPDTIYGSGLNLHNGLDNTQITSMLSKVKSFNGVYRRDQIPHDVKNGFYIINMEPSSWNGDGTHWVSFYIDANKIIYFDGFGVEPPNDVLMLCKHRRLYWNRREIQASTSTACGWFAIAFVLECGKSKNVLSNYGNFIKLFKTTPSENDTILEQILLKHM